MYPLSDQSIDVGAHTAGLGPQSPTAAPDTRLTVEVTPGGTVVVRGEIDSGTASRLQRTLLLALHAHPAGVTLDLSGVTFCDCAGLRAVLAARHRRLAGGLHRLALGPVSARMARLLQLTGTGELLGAPETGPSRAERTGRTRPEQLGRMRFTTTGPGQ
ncbi:STAS domain-containing protein [Streptomyces sp. NPDC017254]|uniref:STAS domain-containing protein n=1 Tax=unclassified Streptomyces TaxID=2593676 RepID=UPI003793B8F6